MWRAGPSGKLRATLLAFENCSAMAKRVSLTTPPSSVYSQWLGELRAARAIVQPTTPTTRAKLAAESKGNAAVAAVAAAVAAVAAVDAAERWRRFQIRARI